MRQFLCWLAVNVVHWFSRCISIIMHFRHYNEGLGSNYDAVKPVHNAIVWVRKTSSREMQGRVVSLLQMMSVNFLRLAI